MSIIVKAWNTLTQEGLRSFLRKFSIRVLRRDLFPDYEIWLKEHMTLGDEDVRALQAEVASWLQPAALNSAPLISVVMPVYNPEVLELKAAIESVQAQYYSRWELCIADDGSTRPGVKELLQQKQKEDSRIRVVFRSENGHISRCSQSALDLATGSWTALLDHDDLLAPEALYFVAKEIRSHPGSQLIYTDEDKVTLKGKRTDPFFKPDWSPELLLAQNFLNHLTVVRTALLREVGGFRTGFEGSQDYDLFLRVTERLQPAQIRHIPWICYHWRMSRGSVARNPKSKNYAYERAREAIREHLQRTQRKGTVVPGNLFFHRVQWDLGTPAPLVSVIVCFKDRPELLKMVTQGLLDKTQYTPLEVLLVNNQSTDAETLQVLEGLKRDSRVRVLHYDHPFNFAAMNNWAAAQARGDVLCFLNNDIEVLRDDWLKEMVGWAVQPGVGLVGAKLFYPSGPIQHAGVVTGIGGSAGHAYKHCSPREPGAQGRAIVTRNVSAVTAACSVVKKEVFDQVKGFDAENFAIAFNDVDLSLRVRDAGFRNVITPHAELNHHESISRGSDDRPETKPRFLRERDALRKRWGHTLERDPYYSPWLSFEAEDLRRSDRPRFQRPWRT